MKRIRVAKYYGSMWLAITGKTPQEDDILSIRFMNLWKLNKQRIEALTFTNEKECFGVCILNFVVQFYK